MRGSLQRRTEEKPLSWEGKLGISSLDQWYKITEKDVENRGLSLLKRYKSLLKTFGNSKWKLVQSLHPQHPWRAWKFDEKVPTGFWNDPSNRRAFMDELGNELGFHSLEGWVEVTQKDIVERGGRSLLQRFGGSIPKLLQGVYSEHEWGFKEKKAVQVESSARLVEVLSSGLKVRDLEDWYRVSQHQIQQLVPLSCFKDKSLAELLVEEYPAHNWDVSKLEFRRGIMKASQRMLAEMVRELFPNSGIDPLTANLPEVKENFSHAGLQSGLDYPMEIDVFLPKERLAFEYQGQQHYSDIYAMGSRGRQRQRDEEKRRLCLEKGITLIEVPYWWDFQKQSLMATIREIREDLVPTAQDSKPIPKEPPDGFPTAGHPELMLGEYWDGKQDLTGWWISEKLDGVRAFWDGKRLTSRQGREIPCPPWFTENLPRDVSLDGELWMGRMTQDKLLGAMRAMRWEAIKYVVFDSPSLKKPFESRMEEIQKLALPPHVKVAEHEECGGNERLLEKLEAVVQGGGEGLMACKPHSQYENGHRSSSLLKVKVSAPPFLD